MAFTLNAALADIDLVIGQAVAQVTPGRNIVVGNLTKGFDIVAIEDRGEEPGEAWSAIGYVPASGNPAGWQIGFIQIAKMHTGGAFYAGRIRSEGSIAVRFENAMPARILLDSKADRVPWTRMAPQFSMSGSEDTAPTSDHPAIKVPLRNRNSGRNVDNFIFHLLDEREFWSILTAIDPAGKRRHLMHFHWRVRYDARFNWVGGRPIVATKDSSFRNLGKAKGAPTDGELQSLINSPGGTLFNDAAANAMKLSFLGARGPNRAENDSWFANVPAGFFS